MTGTIFKKEEGLFIRYETDKNWYKYIPILQSQQERAREYVGKEVEFNLVKPYIWNDGYYSNTCLLCKNEFQGNKMQRICKDCCEKELVNIIFPEEKKAFDRLSEVWGDDTDGAYQKLYEEKKKYFELVDASLIDKTQNGGFHIAFVPGQGFQWCKYHSGSGDWQSMITQREVEVSHALAPISKPIVTVDLPEEKKEETVEEVAKNRYKTFGRQNAFIAGAKWKEQQTFSLEQMRMCFEAGSLSMTMGTSIFERDKYFVEWLKSKEGTW